MLEKQEWAKTFEVTNAAPGRKLIRFVTVHDEQVHFTLTSGPEPHLSFLEPVRFVVTVEATKGGCNVGHEVGDRWEFHRATPEGICGEAYHAMYPVLHGLGLSGGRYDGPAAKGTLVSCPDAGWVTFRIERHLWSPDMWDAGEAPE